VSYSPKVHAINNSAGVAQMALAHTLPGSVQRGLYGFYLFLNYLTFKRREKDVIK